MAVKELIQAKKKNFQISIRTKERTLLPSKKTYVHFFLDHISFTE